MLEGSFMKCNYLAGFRWKGFAVWHKSPVGAAWELIRFLWKLKVGCVGRKRLTTQVWLNCNLSPVPYLQSFLSKSHKEERHLPLLWTTHHPNLYVSVCLFTQRSCKWVSLPFQGIISERINLCRSSPMNKGALLWRYILYPNKILITWEKPNCVGFIGKQSIFCWTVVIDDIY